MRRLFLAFLVSPLFMLGACGSPSSDASAVVGTDPSLRAIELGLEHRYYNRFVRVTRGAGDTLVVRFDGGINLLSGGPGRHAEFDIVARQVAREAAVLADGLLDSCSTVLVATMRPLRFGGFDFGSREERTSFPTRALVDYRDGHASCPSQHPAPNA